MRHKTAALILLGVSVILAAAALALSLRLYGGQSAARSDQSQQTEPTVTPGETAEAGPTATQPPTDTPKPTDTPEPTATPWAGPLVEEQPVPAPAAYFADAGFLGNSVLSGLELYNNSLLLPTDHSHWYWQDSLTIMGASPYAAQMAGQTFGKIYIEFGINELSYDQNTLREAFDTVIDQLQADHPDAIIYLMSVTPVSAYCDANRSFKQGAVIAFNEMLQDIAREQQIWYLDVFPVLCGDDGYLPSEVTLDGIHFTPDHYQRWFDYLTTHYVPDGNEYAAPAALEDTAEDAAAPDAA